MSRQLEEVTFRRSEVKASDLAEGATKYFRRVIKKSSSRLELNVKADPLTMTGDAVLLRYLLENLINEAMTYAGDGVLELQIYKEGAFVRFDFIDVTIRKKN